MGSVCDYWYGVFTGLGVHMGKLATTVTDGRSGTKKERNGSRYRLLNRNKKSGSIKRLKV